MSEERESRFALDDFKDLPLVGRFLERRPRVSVLRLSGVIADQKMHRKGLSYQAVSRAIDRAFEKGRPEAVALVINSPGGSPAQSSLIAGHIRQCAEEKDIPVYAFVEDVAASGGYWLACAADEIYAQESSVVGSVGVISAGFGFEDFIERHGVHRRLQTSGKDKSFMDPFLPEKKADTERLKTLQADIHASFRDWVRSRRAGKLAAEDAALFEGQFWTARPAEKLGLIDGIDDIRHFMREKFGDRVRLADCSPEGKFSLAALFGLGGARQSGSMSENLASDVLEMIEARAVWNRFGF